MKIETLWFKKAPCLVDNEERKRYQIWNGLRI